MLASPGTKHASRSVSGESQCCALARPTAGSTRGCDASIFFAAHARDSVARFAGSSRMVSAYRVLNDTVYFDQRFDAMLPYEQPFGGFDAHNFFASGGNALALYMELNGTRRVEDLCERERAGTLVRPTLAQVTERIRRNGSEAAAMEPADRLAE